jgi:hypothetical protein
MITPSIVDTAITLFKFLTFALAALTLVAWYLQSHFSIKIRNLKKYARAEDTLHEPEIQAKLLELFAKEDRWARVAVISFVSTLLSIVLWVILVLAWWNRTF